MTTPHQVAVGNLLYTVVDDCTTSYRALVTGSVSDEIFGEFYAPEFTVETGWAGLATKTTANGLFALTGNPVVAFPNSAPYPLFNFELRAPGFRTLKVPKPIPAGATFPIIPPLTLTMRRLPVRIQGRVVNDLTRAPIAGAVVLSVDDPLVPPVVHTTALRTPLYFDHNLGTPAQVVTMGGPLATSLATDVARGDQVLSLSACNGLGPHPVLQLSNLSKVIVEYGVVDHFGPGAPGPGQAFLRNPLNHNYSTSATTATFLTATPAGGVANLSTDANAGDGVLLATQLLNWTTLVVDAGSLTEEYHEVGALTDSDGYYAFEGIGRVQEIFLFSSQGALKRTVPWFIEYENAINVVDLRLS